VLVWVKAEPLYQSSIGSNSYPYRVLSIWNDLSPHETDLHRAAWNADVV